MPTLPELLKTTVELQGSDLHLSINSPPQVRVHGELRRLEMPELSPADSKALAYSVLTDAQKKRFEETLRGTAAELAERLRDPVKGEVTLVVAPSAVPAAGRRCVRPCHFATRWRSVRHRPRCEIRPGGRPRCASRCAHDGLK